MAADLVQVLDHAGAGRVHWVGNSLGGILALQMLPAHAGRFRSVVTFGTAYALRLPVAATWLIPLSYAVLGRRLTGIVTAAGTSRHPATRRVIREVLDAYDQRVGRAVATNLARYDLIANGAATDVPILMLRGSLDRGINLALPHTLKTMAGRPNFTLVEVPGAGHCANLDAPEAVRGEILQFWAGH
jgi:pimeloyl-ACP methyl ester carboxylesterase